MEGTFHAVNMAHYVFRALRHPFVLSYCHLYLVYKMQCERIQETVRIPRFAAFASPSRAFPPFLCTFEQKKIELRIRKRIDIYERKINKI